MVLLFILVASIVFHGLEDWSWVDSFYFAVITLTTVGYGDPVPTHDASKIVAAIYSLVSVPLLLLTISIIGEAMFDRYRALQGKKRR